MSLFAVHNETRWLHIRHVFNSVLIRLQSISTLTLFHSSCG